MNTATKKNDMLDQVDQQTAHEPSSQGVDAVAVHFSQGLPGFLACRNFLMTPLEDGNYPPLDIMISQDNPAISFILYAHTSDTSLYTEPMVEKLREPHDINLRPSSAHFRIYTIVTLRQQGQYFEMTTNLRAPLLIDESTGRGVQKILPGSTMETQFPLKRHDMTAEAQG